MAKKTRVRIQVSCLQLSAEARPKSSSNLIFSLAQSKIPISFKPQANKLINSQFQRDKVNFSQHLERRIGEKLQLKQTSESNLKITLRAHLNSCMQCFKKSELLRLRHTSRRLRISFIARASICSMARPLQALALD